MKTIKIQKFGHLIILDLNLNIVGISYNLVAYLSCQSESLLHSKAEDLFTKLFIHASEYKKVKKLVESYVVENSPRSLITVRINKKTYYLKISRLNSLIYIEAENQFKKHISTADLNDIGFLFESKYHSNWKFVCKAINKIIQFDRVFVLQVHETGNCHVIAENTTGQVEPFLNKHFSKDYLPQALIDHYKDSPYRYISDLDAETQNFYTINDTIDINCTQLILPPAIKFQYFNFIGVKTALFFPLFLNGKFWGLVVAHNIQKKFVDLQNRKLCTFIVQNAMSKYEAFMKQGLLDINFQVQEFQNKLIERLAFHKTINCALVESMESLQLMLKSDGIAIFNEGDVYLRGEAPSTELFFEIIRYLQKKNNLNLLKDHNFKKNHKHEFTSELPFAGLLAYNVDKSRDYYIVWFRKESITIETQVTHDSTNPYGLKAVEETLYDTALPWNDEELSLLDGLQNTLNHSLMQKLLENKDLTKNLSKLNNELEMFTYTLSHDLKNPLSVLKMGIDFLKSKNGNIAEAQKEKWFSTISLGLQNIQDIVDNIIDVSHDKINKISKETIPLQYMLRKIVEETKLAYQDTHCEITYGELLPIWAEKSAIYQIFTNIVSNAVKYSQQVPKPKIHINSSINNDFVCYEIVDNGIGIPQQDVDHVFEMFGRAMNTKSYKGSGIGLSLVKRIIERLDGDISIQSNEGTGTIVRMKFPIVKEFP